MKIKRPTWLSSNLLGFGFASLFNDCCHDMAKAVLPLFITQLVGFADAPRITGLISGMADATASIVKIWSGWLSDRIAKQKVLVVIGYTLTPLFVGLLAFVTQLWQLLVCQVMAWIGKGLREPVRDAWLIQVLQKNEYGRAFGFQRALDTLGAILGPIIAFVALQYVAVSTIFLLALIPGIFSIASIVLLTKENVPKQPLPKTKSWINAVMELPQSFKYFLIIRVLFSVGFFNQMLIILRAQELLVTEKSSLLVASSSAILLYLLFNITRACCEFGIGYMSDYVSRKKLIAYAGFGLFGLTCFMLAQPIHIGILIVVFIIAGMSYATVYTVERAYVAELLPANLVATGYGVLQAVPGIGGLCAGIIVGTLWSSWSAQVAFMYSGVIAIVAMVMLLFLSKSTLPSRS